MAKKRKDQMDKEAVRAEKARKKMMDQVARHLRFSVPVKNAVIKGRKVEYFVASKAVDSLMESKWKDKPKNEDDDITPYFTIRDIATKYCATLLEYGYFVRANKVEVKPKAESKDATPRAGGAGGGGGERRKGGVVGEARKRKVTDSPKPKKDDAAEEGKKKKRKFRLEVHQQQVFRDSDDVYYWEYDAASWWTYILGFAVVLGAVAVTLQPLWPDSTRLGFWYLNMGLIGIIGTIVAGLILRWFLFGLVLIVTVGKVHFWILPNLESEKLGVVDSFFPLYSVERPSDEKSSKKKKKKKKDVAPEEEEEAERRKASDGETGEGEKEEEGGREDSAADTQQTDTHPETLKA